MPVQSVRDRFAEVRSTEFSWSGPRIFMNAASFGPLPERTLQAIEGFNRRRHTAYAFPDHEIPVVLDRARSAAARLIGAEPEEIALGPNTTVGLNLAADLLARPPREGGLAEPSAHRRTILVSDREFPANIYPWKSLRRDGFRVEMVPCDELGRPDEASLLERLERDDVAALAISAVQFATGWRADLERLGGRCRERGVLFVVDAIQALGALPLDVRAAGVDILAAGAQKWLCSPWGTGFAYVRSELVPVAEPSRPGWMSFACCSDFTGLLAYDDALLPDARRFEEGTLAIQDFHGMSHSVELLLELGIERVWEHIRAVQAPLLEWVRRRGVVLVSGADESSRSGIVCIRPERPEAVHTALVEAGVVCALREGAVRLSPHFYNTVEEMERVVEVLDRAVGS